MTEDNVKELRKEAEREGMDGISPRYIQDKISQRPRLRARGAVHQSRSWS